MKTTSLNKAKFKVLVWEKLNILKRCFLKLCCICIDTNRSNKTNFKSVFQYSGM